MASPAAAIRVGPQSPAHRPGRDTGPVSAPLPAPPGTTSLLSFRYGGSPTAGPAGGGPSAQVAISSSGRYVAFTSGAPDLVPGDTNQVLDVFTLDRSTGAMIRLGILGGVPVPPAGSASQPSISADGRIVAFTYQPPPGITGANAGSIVLAWDRKTGNVELVSRNPRGTGAGPSYSPSVSADGRFVAYVSGSNAIAGRDANNLPDVFRYDRTTHQTVLVSAEPNGITAASGTSDQPSISGDGNLVAFESDAGLSIVPEKTGPGMQVYVRDIASGTTQRISSGPGGVPANGVSQAPAISADGRSVAFDSAASNIVAGDVNNAADVFLRDRMTGITTLVSITPDGVPATGASGQAAISADGRVVAFASTATDLTALSGDLVPAAFIRGGSEVYARDVQAGRTIMVSVTSTGTPGTAQSITPAVGGGGRFIAFASTAGNLVSGDNNEVLDAFLRDLPPVPRLNPAVLDLGAAAIGTATPPAAATLSNAGWGPLTVTGPTITGAAASEFEIVADSCSKAVLHLAEACTVTVTFTPATEGVRTATLQVADSFTGSPRTARLTGIASLARLVLDPPIGPPGIVTIATGAGFPPNTEVRLAWSPGITPTLQPIITDANGDFRVQVLVFHNDQVGPRSLVVTAANGTAFPSVAAQMFVTQPSSVPPSFSTLRFFNLPLMLVIRG